jgi:hypothetical protein
VDELRQVQIIAEGDFAGQLSGSDASQSSTIGAIKSNITTTSSSIFGSQTFIRRSQPAGSLGSGDQPAEIPVETSPLFGKVS